MRGSVNVPCVENSIWSEGREQDLKRWAASVISGEDGAEPKTKKFSTAHSLVFGAEVCPCVSWVNGGP